MKKVKSNLIYPVATPLDNSSKLMIKEIKVMTNNTDNRILYLDILRVFAMLAVVHVHISVTDLILNFHAVSLKYWWIENVFASSSKWCVPIFVMLSGTLLLKPSKNESIKYFFKKRCFKVVFPFITWGIIYIVWNVKDNISRLSIKYIVEQYVQGPVFWHMWFIYMIMVLYLLTPVIRVYIYNADDTNIKYFLVLLFISTSILELLEKITHVQFNSYFKFQSIWGFAGYYILGYFLNKVSIKKEIRKYIYILAFFCLITIPFGTYIFTQNNKGVLDSCLYEYTNPLIIIVSIAIFLLFKNIDWNKIFIKRQRMLKLLFNISSASLGIYLIHPLVMGILTLPSLGIKIFNQNYNPLIRISIMDVIVFVISYFIIRLIQKIPYFKYMVP